MASKKKPTRQKQMKLPEVEKPVQPADFTVVIESGQGYRKYLDATPEQVKPLLKVGWRVVEWLNEDSE